MTDKAKLLAIHELVKDYEEPRSPYSADPIGYHEGFNDMKYEIAKILEEK